MGTLIGRRGILAAGVTLSAAGWARNSALARGGSDDASRDMRPLSDIVRLSPPVSLPDLAFTDLTGARVTLKAFAGQPLVLNFWATWCAPCVAELPDLDKLAASGVVVVAASTDRGGAAAVKPFLTKHDIGHARVVLDTGSDATHSAGVVGFPTTLIIDAKGQLRGRLEGPADWSVAGPAITSLTKLT